MPAGPRGSPQPGQPRHPADDLGGRVARRPPSEPPMTAYPTPYVVRGFYGSPGMGEHYIFAMPSGLLVTNFTQ